MKDEKEIIQLLILMNVELKLINKRLKIIDKTITTSNHGG